MKTIEVEYVGVDGEVAGTKRGFHGFGVKRGNQWAHPAHGRSGGLRDYPYVFRQRSHATACANRWGAQVVDLLITAGAEPK